jgi:RNA polymerase sigma-70 factor, ECF subfamily
MFISTQVHMSVLDPTQLIEEAKKGNRDAFGQLYQTFLVPVYRYVYLRVPHRPTAEDLTQVVFIKVYENLSRYTAHAAPLAYFFTIARNTIIDHVRKKKPEYLEDYPELASSLQDTSNGPEEELNTKQDTSRVLAKVKKLTLEQKTVITLKFFNGLKNSEVAQMLGKSEDAVRQLQCRALKALRGQLVQ